VGAWCGYVGVPKGHPYHGNSYDHDGVNVDVHGGLSFANGCADMSHEEWIKGAKYLASKAVQEEAAKHPRGDMAQRIREWGPVSKDYALWREKMEATHVCHKPDPGEPDNVWWFGFDCAHAFDKMPALRRYSGYSHPSETYRDQAYVTAEVEKLASQLLQLEESHG